MGADVGMPKTTAQLSIKKLKLTQFQVSGGKGMEFYSLASILAFFQKGGLFMYPILFVFAAGMVIAVERWFQLGRIRSVNRKMWNVMLPILVKGEFDKARQMVSKDKSTISQMLAMGLARQGAFRRRDDIEIAMEESMMEIIPQLEKRTPYVALLSNIATLLGLLGTIMGLIEAFTAVANANPAEKADLLSASISVAMNTTAFGLMSAIPLLLFHAKLTSITGQIIDSLEMASVKALNTISNFKQLQFETNPETSDSDVNLSEENREVPSETAEQLSEAQPRSETTASSTAGSTLSPEASGEG
jgi:biopolymer transport protein ExbB